MKFTIVNMSDLISKSLASQPAPAVQEGSAWRRAVTMPSLPEAHRSILIAPNLSWFRKILAFAGPGYLVAVGYMDPGNWATDLGGGSKFGYTMLSGLFLSTLMARPVRKGGDRRGTGFGAGVPGPLFAADDDLSAGGL